MRCGLLPLAANNSAMQTMYRIGFSPRTDGIGSEMHRKARQGDLRARATAFVNAGVSPEIVSVTEY